MALNFFCLICFSYHDISKSIHVVTNGSVSFLLWLSSIPLYICTISSLSNHLLKDTSVHSDSLLEAMSHVTDVSSHMAQASAGLSAGPEQRMMGK